MTVSSVGAQTANAVQRPHHHHHQPGGGGAPAAAAATDGSPAGATPTGSAAPQSGIGKFASELQSILLSAQSGEPSAAGTTASDPSTASDPAGATDVTTPSGSAHGGGAVKHLADRLQDLLGGTGSAATPAAGPAGSGNGLQDVLARLQSTLQQTLANYQTAGTTAAPATSITA